MYFEFYKLQSWGKRSASRRRRFIQRFLKYIEDSKHIWEGNVDEVRYTSIGSVIGTHAGPGAVAVAFFKK